MLVIAIADAYGSFSIIHTFREGNGRALRILFEWLIVNAGYEINWWEVNQDEWILVNINSFYGDNRHLIKIFNCCIGENILINDKGTTTVKK